MLEDGSLNFLRVSFFGYIWLVHGTMQWRLTEKEAVSAEIRLQSLLDVTCD